ncbi:hypothetical protein [Sphaerisporangium flaviroseum]
MTVTHDPGDDLRPLLAAAVSDGPAATDLLAGVRRARRGRRVLVRVGSLATAGALAATALTVWSVGNAPSAQAQLVAAVENTSGQGYHIHAVNKNSGRSWDGAFDPATQTGRLAASDGGLDLFIGGTVYHKITEPERLNAQTLSAGKQWISEPLPTEAEWAQMGIAGTVIKRSELNPQLVLERLRSATNVQETGSASGAGWTGKRYSFTIKDNARPEWGSVEITGTVAVDSQDLVRVLDITISEDGPADDGAEGQSGGDNNMVTEFSDYGTTVDVTAPPADQVISSGTLDKVKPRSSGKDSREPAPSDQANGSDKVKSPPSGTEPQKPAASTSPGS